MRNRAPFVAKAIALNRAFHASDILTPARSHVARGIALATERWAVGELPKKKAHHKSSPTPTLA
jgi:hypothetical protein